ncbi:GHKL domain-containing protein, partial [Candidatus Bipolaricaulota bacterium]|nr:GHKL domain-containing protein [Candidatus Bipolaricaulota bacterium]
DLISDLEEDLRYVLEDVNLVLPEELPKVYGNKTLLTELFSNLITNAAKYNDKDEPRIEIGWEKKGDKFLISVEDNGQGIKDRYLEKIFKVFEKLNPRDNPEGTGIGLAVCKRIVEEHRGDIWAESELGEGTTFFFTLPAKKGQMDENISGREITNGVNFSRVNS